MGIEYFPCYHSYLRKIAKLSDQEVGRLFRALLIYSATGERQELTGREDIAFDFIADDIDRAKESYDERCNQNRDNGRKGGRPKKKKPTASLETERFSKNPTVFSETQKSQSKDEDEDEDKSKDKGNIYTQRSTSNTTTMKTKENSTAETEGRPRPRDGQDTVGDPELGKVMSFYLDHINSAPGNTVIAGLTAYTSKLGAEMVLYAMDIAQGERKLNWSYIRGILRNWENRGFRSVADVEAEERERESRRTGGRDNGVSSNQGGNSGGSASAESYWDDLPGIHNY